MVSGGSSVEPLLDAPQPGGEAAATARYGLTSEPGHPQLEPGRALALPGITRQATVRLSTPQVGLVGAQNPSTSRL